MERCSGCVKVVCLGGVGSLGDDILRARSEGASGCLEGVLRSGQRREVAVEVQKGNGRRQRGLTGPVTQLLSEASGSSSIARSSRPATSDPIRLLRNQFTVDTDERPCIR